MSRAYAGSTPSAVGAAPLSHLPAAIGDHVFAGHYGDMAVLAGHSLTTCKPDDLTEFVTSLEPGWTVLLLSLDPLTATGTFARWEDGRLQRAFAADPIRIHADVALPYPFESPFWAGEHPLQYQAGVEADPLALPFHPAELAEEANRRWLGFRFTPPIGDDDTDTARVPVFEYEILASDATAVRAADVPPLDLSSPVVEAREIAAPQAPTPAPLLTVPVAQPVEAPVDATADQITAPLSRRSDAVPAPDQPAEPKTRKPGPISRYFGFRGRL